MVVVDETPMQDESSDEEEDSSSGEEWQFDDNVSGSWNVVPVVADDGDDDEFEETDFEANLGFTVPKAVSQAAWRKDPVSVRFVGRTNTTRLLEYEPFDDGTYVAGPRGGDGKVITPVANVAVDRDQFDFEFVKNVLYPSMKAAGLPRKSDALWILGEAADRMKEFPNVLEVPVVSGRPITVFGDTHGQFYDVCAVFERNGFPSPESPYIFNGDFVDRGSWGVENLVGLLALFVCLEPGSIYLIRGNHETEHMTKQSGFFDECQDKYDVEVFRSFVRLFESLPIAAVVNGTTFVCHGGLFSDNVSIAELQAIDRFVDGSESVGYLTSILWSDPVEADRKSAASMRCPGAVCFNRDVTTDFLALNDLEMLVRSHQMAANGYYMMHEDLLMTLFSAPCYCGEHNFGAYLKISSDNEFHIYPFAATYSPPAKVYFEACSIQ